MDAAAADATPLTIVLCGDSAVGKSTLAALASPPCSATVFATHTTRFVLGTSAYAVTLRDTVAGPEALEGRKRAYEGANVIFLLYSVISPSSLASATSVWSAELRAHSPGAPVILLATKTDLRDDAEVTDRLAKRGLTPVSLEQGQRAAQAIGALGFFEMSCAPGANPLERVFSQGLQLVFGPPKPAGAGRRGARTRIGNNNNRDDGASDGAGDDSGATLRGKNCCVQ